MVSNLGQGNANNVAHPFFSQSLKQRQRCHPSIGYHYHLSHGESPPHICYLIPEYINERGGVNGILVETKWIDHRATSSRAIIGHKRLKEAGCILEMDCISTCIEATLSSIQRDEVPMLVTCAFSPAMFTEPIRWVFSMIPGFDSDFATFIWINSQVAAEAIRLAVERVGFENLTGRSVRDALASMKDFNTGLIPPITMSEDKPYYAKVRVYQVQKGKMVPLSDWLEWAYFLEF